MAREQLTREIPSLCPAWRRVRLTARSVAVTVADRWRGQTDPQPEHVTGTVETDAASDVDRA
ncbi:hypothetical protein IFM12276_40520 [Nocardia sputorum]|uniref:Uncharacterized protein n=1 Tax=Nocardia sputorum TaxID=2984338 RepID=A0ABN6U6V9_9NOCA|nr:hypothetical protein IFM12276_40520 [Nocardia sputorum]